MTIMTFEHMLKNKTHGKKEHVYALLCVMMLHMLCFYMMMLELISSYAYYCVGC